MEPEAVRAHTLRLCGSHFPRTLLGARLLIEWRLARRAFTRAPVSPESPDAMCRITAQEDEGLHRLAALSFVALTRFVSTI